MSRTLRALLTVLGSTDLFGIDSLDWTNDSNEVCLIKLRVIWNFIYNFISIKLQNFLVDIDRYNVYSLLITISSYFELLAQKGKGGCRNSF